MRIAVAVSGGVDSLCALLLLRRAGHDVLALHGFFLPEQSHPRPGGACDPLPGLEAACRALGIPLHTVDLRVVFQREVMIPFARSYAEGRTPNPCARCNRAVKFGALMDAALDLGADKLATGHYARLLPGRNGEKEAPPVLAAAHDRAKDQSYFLSLVPAARLPDRPGQYSCAAGTLARRCAGPSAPPPAGRPGPGSPGRRALADYLGSAPVSQRAGPGGGPLRRRGPGVGRGRCGRNQVNRKRPEQTPAFCSNGNM